MKVLLQLFFFIVYYYCLIGLLPQNVTVEKDPDDPHSKAIVSWFPPENQTALEISGMKYCVRYCVQPKKDCKTRDTKPGEKQITIEDLEDRQSFEISVAACCFNKTDEPECICCKEGAGSFTEIKELITDGKLTK